MTLLCMIKLSFFSINVIMELTDYKTKIKTLLFSTIEIVNRSNLQLTYLSKKMQMSNHLQYMDFKLCNVQQIYSHKNNHNYFSPRSYYVSINSKLQHLPPPRHLNFWNRYWSNSWPLGHIRSLVKCPTMWKDLSLNVPAPGLEKKYVFDFF